MKYNTKRREDVLAFLTENAHSSYSAEQISLAVLEDGRGKSTVYRILAELVADGQLRRIADGESRHITYQYVGGECGHRHLHLKCKDCGRLIHLDEGTSSEVKARLSVGGFTIDEGELLLGRCNACGGTNDKLSS